MCKQIFYKLQNISIDYTYGWRHCMNSWVIVDTSEGCFSLWKQMLVNPDCFQLLAFIPHSYFCYACGIIVELHIDLFIDTIPR